MLDLCVGLSARHSNYLLITIIKRIQSCVSNRVWNNEINEIEGVEEKKKTVSKDNEQTPTPVRLDSTQLTNRPKIYGCQVIVVVNAL